MLPLYAFVQSWLVAAAPPSHSRSSPVPAGRRARGDAGQATAEYALILIGAAAVAVLLLAWATKTDRVGKLFDLVMERVSGRAK